MSESGLTNVTTEDLRRLLEIIEQKRIQPPLSPSLLYANNLGHLTSEVGILMNLDDVGAVAVLRAILAERKQHQGPQLSLVWTGPDTKISETRYTAIVVDELFEKAREYVIIGGYSFDHGAELFSPLHRVMYDHGVKTNLFVDIRQMDISLRRWANTIHRDVSERLELIEQAKEQSPDRYADEIISWFLDTQWPFGKPRPDVYYDPRTADIHNIASLHAKCLVVDNRYALITSANFTDRGQTRNIEAGVLIEGRFAAVLAAQWQKLIDSRLVKQQVEG